MSVFTLAKALGIIGRHLVITLAIGFAVYFLLPSLNIVENRYTVSKVVNFGSNYNKAMQADLLNTKTIKERIASAAFRISVNKKLSESDGNLSAAQFKVSTNEDKITFLTAKSHDKDLIIKTLKAIMETLQVIDKEAIQKQIDEIDSIIDHDKRIMKILIDGDKNYSITNDDINEYVAWQKLYDESFNIDDNIKNSGDISSIVRLNFELQDKKNHVKRSVVNSEKKISDLELAKQNDFESISYLYPPLTNQLRKYFPNSFLYFGISFLFALLYNLFLLNYKFRESVK